MSVPTSSSAKTTPPPFRSSRQGHRKRERTPRSGRSSLLNCARKSVPAQREDGGAVRANGFPCRQATLGVAGVLSPEANERMCLDLPT